MAMDIAVLVIPAQTLVVHPVVAHHVALPAEAVAVLHNTRKNKETPQKR
jgi:hypothetical protein